MKIEIFKLERNQSLYENLVKYNLTESDVHPYSIRELLSKDQIEELLDLPMGYPQTNGIIPLRKNIAIMYPKAEIDNILVTNGSSEANFLTIWSLLNPGDELLFMVPNFMQIWGLARSFDITVKLFSLRQDLGWEPDFDQISGLITEKTKMISICNPNNPTGHIMDEESRNRIVDIAEKNDLWLHCDEIYRGAEFSGKEVSTFYGTYNKVLISSGLSKAYALQGTRLGWLVGPKGFIERAWEFSDYTTISSSMLSQKIAAYVLDPNLRKQVLDRNRKVLIDNLETLTEWVQSHGTLFEFIPPQAGGMVFIKYNFDMNSTMLTDKLRKEKSVFVVAGDWFGMDGYIRIGIGTPPEYLKKGLTLIDELLTELEISNK